ncbi:MAG: ATP-binding protein [Streptococcaceae bacterium]|nr:ATP-binding protein [Streptococcaceae bacterium]
MIVRKQYLDRISPFIDKDIVKVITGVRRSGKSVFLRQLMDQIESSKTIYFNFEKTQNESFWTNSRKLDETIQEFIRRDDEKTYIFLDEVQLVQGWEIVVNSLRASFDVDIYITGSNAQLLSGELATYLAGRYVSIEIYPFSYKEFLENSPGASFEDYLTVGGMPMASDFLDSPEARKNLLEDIYDSVLLRDVISRNKIRDTDLLNRLLIYIFSEVGHVFSANSLSKYFKSEGRKVSTDTILNYLHACEQAYLMSRVTYQDALRKKILNVNDKVYVIDHGIREALLESNIADIERVLENIVYYELLRRGYKVTIGRNGEKEIDFIAQKAGYVEYFQVSYLLQSAETREREFGAYRGIDDNFPKFVLSMDALNFSQRGIVHENIEKWLLE